MAGFHYKMQNILNIKEKMESQAKMDFSRAQMKLNQEKEKLAALRERRAGYFAEAVTLRSGGLRVRDILDNREAIARMDEYIEAQTAEVVVADKIVEEARMRLQEVMQERKTQEKLREKAFEEFMKEENAKESKEIDELTSYTYGRKQREKTAK